MKKIFQPFSRVTQQTKNIILLGWVIVILINWSIVSAVGTTHLFPTVGQVASGFAYLWNHGLVSHLGSSLTLCFISVMLSVSISLIICYSSPLSALKPISVVVSKLRYLPLTGIAYYISIAVHGARGVQIGVLVVFMTTFLVTSLLGMIADIKTEEYDHARTLGCSRWETLWEVVIKGRMDYVIEVVRQNLAIVWMMLVTVESVLASAGGLGFLIKNNDKTGDNGKVIAIQIIIILVGIGLDFLLNKIRKSLYRYSTI